MNMRSTMTGLFGAAVIAISSLGLVGCSEATSPAADMPESLVNVTIPSPAMDEGIFYEASLDEPMAVERPGTDMKRVPFGDLLRALKLTPEQQETVKGLLAAHEDCMKAAMSALRESERAILAPFNEKRNAIREAVKNGSMTREEARTALAEINKSAREALRANADARKAAAEAAKKCREDFINALRGILSPEQLPVLERWLAGQNGPKGGGRDTTNVGPGKGGPRGGGDTTNVGPGKGGPRGGDTTNVGPGKGGPRGGGDTTNVGPGKGGPRGGGDTTNVGPGKGGPRGGTGTGDSTGTRPGTGGRRP